MDDEMKKFADNYYSVTSVNDFDNSRDVEVLKYKYFMLGCELIYNQLRASQKPETSDEALPIDDVGGSLPTQDEVKKEAERLHKAMMNGTSEDIRQAKTAQLMFLSGAWFARGFKKQ